MKQLNLSTVCFPIRLYIVLLVLSTPSKWFKDLNKFSHFYTNSPINTLGHTKVSFRCHGDQSKD